MYVLQNLYVYDTIRSCINLKLDSVLRSVILKSKGELESLPPYLYTVC